MTTFIKPNLQKSLTFLFAFLGVGILSLSGGLVWPGNWVLQGLTWVLGGIGLAYLLYLGWVRRERMIKTPIDLIFILAVVTLLILWAIEPNPRQGLERVAYLLSYGVVFFGLVAGFSASLDRQSVLNALAWVTGLLLVLAGLEVYVRYSAWWQQVGDWAVQPPYPYRLASFIGHSNSFTGLINLLAPLALSQFFSRKTLPVKMLWGLWLAFYIIAIPFGSSRGGWLGLGGWAAGLLLLWLSEKQSLSEWLAYIKRHWRLAAASLVLGIPAALYAAYRFWLYFAAHPSHGAIFGGRTDIWSSALAVWMRAPLTGAGPGRFAYEVLAALPIAIPGFWAQHAHSIPVEILAEMGPFGLAWLLLLLFIGARWFWKVYRASDSGAIVENRALLAGLLGWSVQLIFDDQSMVPAVMIPALIIMAYLVSSASLPRRSWSLGWGVIPAAALLVLQGWILWAAVPYAQGAEQAAQNQWRPAAELISLSAQRDPDLSFYSVQAGLAWAQIWSREQDLAALQNARRWLRLGLQKEPALALFWADLAVLDWQAGEKTLALQDIEQAVQRGPAEASYFLNKAWFLEQTNDLPGAKAAYQQALVLQPAWINHPFWQGTQLRRQIQQAAPQSPTGLGEYSQKAVLAAAAGDQIGAAQALAFADWVGEPLVEQSISRAKMARAFNDPPAALLAVETLRAYVSQDHLLSYNVASAYALWMHRRTPLPVDLVPGYLQLIPDQGQYAIMEQAVEEYQNQKRCAEAELLARTLQEARLGMKQNKPSFVGTCGFKP